MWCLILLWSDHKYTFHDVVTSNDFVENINHIGKVGVDFNGDSAKQVKDANSIFFEKCANCAD